MEDDVLFSQVFNSYDHETLHHFLIDRIASGNPRTA